MFLAADGVNGMSRDPQRVLSRATSSLCKFAKARPIHGELDIKYKDVFICMHDNELMQIGPKLKSMTGNSCLACGPYDPSSNIRVHSANREA